ncbi:MAG: hypothetical protein D6B27_08270 [Gammaproteobacteria bacterium]|nr:MAG: hypothetical protein D6B27_08270 [Gammaproteobacteria bacterium]
MDNLKNIVNLMHDCFEADKRQQSFWNVFSKNYQHLKFLDDDEKLLTRSSSAPIVPANYASAVSKTLLTYKREKELLYSSFLLIGQVKNDSFTKKICAPLACYNTVIYTQTKGKNQISHAVNIDYNQPLLNLDVLQQIIEDDISTFPTDIFYRKFNSDSLPLLKKWFCNFPHTFDTSFLDSFPALLSRENITKIMEQNSGKIFVVPAAALLVVKKSFLSQGVLYELEQIAEDKTLLESLKSLFAPSKSFFADYNTAPIPAILSDSQKRIIHNSKNYTLSTVIGPPGTGKSYTIAALALEYFMNQKSVLIVSNTEQSISVIEQKLIEQFSLNPKALIRCGDGSHHKKLKNNIESILKKTRWDINDPAKKVNKAADNIKILEENFSKKCQKFFNHSRLVHKSENVSVGIVDKIRLALLKRSQRKSVSLKQDLDKIQAQQQELEKSCIDYINFKWQQRVANTVKKNRKHLSNFLIAIKARSSSKQEKFFEETDFDVLLNVMPIWLVSLSNLHRVLPLQNNLFDLVIFDEATQCNIASALPAIVRAERAVIVGDPKQLRHFSFLSNELQSHLFQQYPFSDIPAELNYRNESILDVAQQLLADNDSISYLDEHFRSHPQIIGYSNNNFYNSLLKIMTQKPFSDNERAIEINYGSEGVLKKGVNKPEAERLLYKLLSITKSQKDMDYNIKSSIGILALFSNQADYLESKIMKILSEEELDAHKIRVGTAYSFQGEERDIMLISCCVDSNCTASNYQYINRDDSFNVAITRARDKQILFTSATKKELLPNSHLATYVKYCEKILCATNISTYSDAFQKDLCNELKKYGIEIRLQFEVASIPVDIVANHNGSAIGIDLIGFPGEMENYISLQSIKLLGRAKLMVIPISYNEWILNRKQVLNEILSLFACKPEPCSAAIYNPNKKVSFSFLEQIQKRISYTVEELELLLLSNQLKFLENLQKSYCNLISVAHNELQPESISFQRFRSIAISIFEQCLENIHSIISSTKQINIFSDSIKDSELLISEAKSLIDKLNDENSILLSKMNQIAAELSKQNLSDNGFDMLANEIDRHIEIAREFKNL